MNKAEMIAQQMAAGISNAKIWANVFYNVRDYGAKGNGVKDDSAAIQKAINAAFDDGGGTVFFPPGTYNITSSLFHKATVSYQGASMKNSVLRWATKNGGVILDTSNADLRWCSFRDLTFTLTAAAAGTNVTGILGGSTLTNYNSAVALFENLYFADLKYGIRGNAVPAGVGIFDSTFINVWANACFYGLWIHGSQNVIIQPRVTYCDSGLVLSYLNGESFGSVKLLGGLFAANNYDIGITEQNGTRASAFFGTWFEQSAYGIINIVNANTKIQSMTFDNCTLSSNSPTALMDLTNAVGKISVDTCTIAQSLNNVNNKTIFEPSSLQSNLEIRNTQVLNWDGTTETLDSNDANHISAAHAYQTVSQSIPATTFTMIAFGTKKYDNRSEFDLTTNLFTAKKSGLYQVSAGIRLTTQADGNRCLFTVYKNGSTELVLYDEVAGGSSVSAVSGSGTVKLNAGDTIGLYLYSTGAVTTASAGSWNTHYLTITKVSS